MLEIYSSNQTITSNSLLPFTSVALQKGNTQQLSGSNSVVLNKCGLYEVTLEISGLPSEAGNVQIDMMKNNIAQTQSKISIPNAVTTSGVTGSLTTFVQVNTNACKCFCSSPTTINFNNSGVGMTNVETHMIIRKIY
jgi:hypothetical protein